MIAKAVLAGALALPLFPISSPLSPPSARASAAVQTPTPFSTLLDFGPMRAAASSAPGGEANSANYPIWLESVEFPRSATRTSGTMSGESIIRLRLRALPGLSDRLLLRLFFHDRVGEPGPRVTGWSETGEQRYHSGEQGLGLGLGLPASEALVIDAQDIDYLEITTPNDPENAVLRQALVASLRESEQLVALDFSAIASLADPFSRERAVLGDGESDEGLPLPPADADTFLFGRTRAVLHPGVIHLSPGSVAQSTVHIRFSLSAVPLLAMATFHIHHADPTAPLQVWINGEPAGSASVDLPDLADPGYIAASRRFSATRFRYIGWLRGQIAFPGRLLRTGENTLSLQLPEEAAPVVLHRLELQLKSHWQKLDYTLESH